jgi:polyphosphate kinase
MSPAAPTPIPAQANEPRFFNRDLSWLKFNERVLKQASDVKVPLLERLRFLAIYSTNLDEFFMKRMGHLKRLSEHDLGIAGTSVQVEAGRLMVDLRAEILHSIRERHQVYEKLLPELNKQGIFFLKWADLNAEERKNAQDYFLRRVFPVLTPLAVDKAHPFPFLSNLSVSLGIILRHPKKNETLFARIKIPDTLPQWVQVASTGTGNYRLIRLRDLVSANLSELFPDMIIESVMPFRVTRSAEIEDTIDDVEDRLDMVETELRLRRLAPIVRLEHGGSSDKSMLNFLQGELDLDDLDMYENPGEISYHSLPEVCNLNIPKLRYPIFQPTVPVAVRDNDADIFSIIRKKDMLVHFPFESFHDSVERFLEAAADDDKVLAIKITLYRAGENNPLIPLLIRAAEKGKQVVCVVELKARFDEARNIKWGEILEKAGVHVVYGVVGKKIHSKIVLVIRQEGENYRYYSHIGTGNYNPTTAKVYTDFNLFTSDKRIGGELIEVFNFLTGLSLKKNYQKLLVAPVNMRKRFVQHIRKEIDYHKATGQGHIIAKMNALEDTEICELLYTASQAGVKIQLIVRGFCCLRPGVTGLSENIQVISTIGRFLEHSRVFYFRRGAEDPMEGKFYVGSADWMYRNLNNRIEVVAPVEQPSLRSYLWRVLNDYLQDQNQNWILQPDGKYVQKKSNDPAEPGIHQKIIQSY